METSPKETVNDAIDLAAIVRLPSELGVGASQCLFEALLPLQRVVPAVARLRQALYGIADPEIQRMRACQFVPRQRHRYRRARFAAWRVGDVQRLAANVHVVIHEDLTRSLGHTPLNRDVFRVQTRQMPTNEL